VEYFKKKIAFILFFENKSLYSNINYLIYPKLTTSVILTKDLKFLYFFDKIYNYIYVNKFSIIKIHNIMYEEFATGLRGLGYNLSRFLKYYYVNYCYKSGYESLNTNFLRSRTVKKTKGSNLMGYKMYLMGRFTRKQRAGHL